MNNYPNVVVIGGGTGSFTVLSGLKKYPLNISAIISMMDSGGSTGRLRDQLGVLPPGDIRQALVALSDSSDIWRKLFTYRYDNGDLKGHNFGNIFLSTIEKITGSNKQALVEIANILNVNGKVIPVTFDNCSLCAKYQDGSIICGESSIDESLTSRPKIKKLYLKPQAKINSDALLAIKNADFIVLGPGDLYTSIFPNLIVKDFSTAISNCKAIIIYISNLMTKLGQTDGFTLKYHVKEVEKYLGTSNLDYVLVNTKKPEDKILKWYKKYGNVVFVEDDLKQKTSFKIIRQDLLSDKVYSKDKNDYLKRSLIRHDSNKICKELVNIFNT